MFILNQYLKFVNYFNPVKSYLIGGAYDCSDNQDQQYCGHLNVQRAVMKLSSDSCGLDIVMDGISKKVRIHEKAKLNTFFSITINKSL